MGYAGSATWPWAAFNGRSATRALIFAAAGVSARGAADTRAGVDAIRGQGDAALHAELRRCWTPFNDQPVPDDLI